MSPPPTSNTDGKANWAVIVGVERYRDDLPKATWAEADARMFEAYAKTTLGIPPAHYELEMPIT